MALEDKGWSDKKNIDKEETTVALLRYLNIEPSEVSPDDRFPEGAAQRVLVNRYERDLRARKLCVSKYGSTCAVCNFNFAAVYGALAEGFIHVHHLKPLSEVGVEYLVDPLQDLRPVCPNCHAVLHLGGKLRTIEEVRQLLRRKSST